MCRDKEIKQVALQVGIALSAGVFSFLPSVSAAPVLDHVVTEGAVVDQKTTPKVTDITSETRNNVIDWKDFSVAKDEMVRFDGGEKQNNYLNVVSGANTSNIDGAIKGGDNVYIVNPNGVVFGNSASVDVGSLYVSSRPLDAVNYKKTDAHGDMQPLADTASMRGGDIVNMGTVQADSVFVEGGNIVLTDVERIKNSDGKAVNNNVTIQTQGDITLGRSVTSVLTEKKADNTDKGMVSFANSANGTKSNSSAGGGYTYTFNNDAKSALSISDETELKNVKNTGLGQSYIVTDDITVTGSYTPIGTFTGTFDGMYHTISGITYSSTGTTSYGGLFSKTSGATIKNVGVSGGSIKANVAGGIVAQATNTKFINVFNVGTKVTGRTANGHVGGIVGEISGGSIDTAYNTATVGESGGKYSGGIAGQVDNTTISHVYNTGSVENGIVGKPVYDEDTTKINDAFSTSGGIKGADAPAGIIGTNVIETVPTSKNVADYTGKLSSISNKGGEDTTWRIYEGQSLPLLRAFLKGHGTVTVNYDYKHGSQIGSNGGKDLTAESVTSDGKLTYNGSYVEVNGTPTYSGADDITASKIKYSNTSVKNVKTQALFYTDQQGYDLVGNNVTMAKRTVTVDGADVKVSKTYDGVTDATAAFKTAFANSSGLGTSGGILPADKDNVSVGYSDNFSATFETKDAGPDNPITFTGSLTLNDTTGNYDLAASSKDLSKVTTVTGEILQRKLNLTINPTSGIDKTYDGKTTVQDAYAPSKVISLDTSNPIAAGSEKAQTTDVGLISGDTVELASANTTAQYVDVVNDVATPNANAGAHKVQYSGVALKEGGAAKNYQLQYTATGNTTPTLVTDNQVFLDGTINRRLIDETSFKVLKPSADDPTVYEEVEGTKPYDGTSNYNMPEGARLTANTAANGDTGIVDEDSDKLWFELSGDTVNAYFTDASGTKTDMVAAAKNIAFKVKAATKDGYDYLTKNYKIGTTANAKNLDTATDLSVSGAGTITRRELWVKTDDVANINKTYNGTTDVEGDAIKMGGGYIGYTANTTDDHKLLADSSESAKDTAKWNITAQYDTKDVVRGADNKAKDNGKTVNFTIGITGADAGNYMLNGENAETAKVELKGTGKIDPAKLTPTFTPITKTYSGTLKIDDGDSDFDAANLNGTVTGFTVDGKKDDVKLYYEAKNASFDQKNAGERTITYTGLSLTGDDKGNYDLVDSNGVLITEATGAGKINKRPITADDITPTFATIAKVYDNKTDIENYKSKLTKLEVKNVTDDDLQFTVTSGQYINKNRLGGKDLQENGVAYTISLTDAEQLKNYTLTDGNGLSGNTLTLKTNGYIYQAPITVSITGNPTKSYDGGKSVDEAVSSLMKIDGLYADGTTNASTALYDKADAGNREVIYTLGLNEPEGNNYKFVDANGAAIETVKGTGVINKRTLGVTFGKVSDIYYGGNAVKATITPTVTNAVGSDGTAIAANLADALKGIYGSGTTDDTFVSNSDVGDKDVQYSNLNTALGDNYSKNYQFASDTGYGLGEITQAKITMNNFKFNFANVSKEYDGDELVDWTKNNDFVTDHYIDLGDSHVNFDYTINKATYNNKHANTGKPVTYSIKIKQPSLTNFDIENFDENYFSSRTLNVGTITPKTVYAEPVKTVEKTYDAKTDIAATGAALVKIDGLAQGDSNISTAVYTDANRGENIAVNYTVAINDGNNGKNYIIYTPQDTTAPSSTFTTLGNIISPRNLKLTFDPVTKDYDGTTSVPTNLIHYTLEGKQKNKQGLTDAVDVESYTAAYNDPNVLKATTITYDNIVLSGNEHGNYVLVGADGTTPLNAGSSTGKQTTGIGHINKYVLTSKPIFTVGNVSKEYDTTAKVAYNRDTDLDTVKGAYLKSSKVEINGVEQQLPFELLSAVYTGADEAEAAAVNTTGKTAEFKLKLSSDNIDFGSYVTGNGLYTVTTDTAVITPRKVYVSLADDMPVISKVYDGNKSVSQTVTNKVIAREGDLLSDGTGVIISKAEYKEKDAGNWDVTYDVQLTGAAAGNYEIHRLENLDTAADSVYSTLVGKGDITKATLTLSPVAVDKIYNGTAKIGDDGSLTRDKLVLNGVNGEQFTFSEDAFKKVSGQYGLDSSAADFQTNANVSWNGNTVLDKAVLYTGLSEALAVMNGDANNNSISKNYTIDNTAYFTAAQEKGKIKPVTITQSLVENWKPVIREYNADKDLNEVYDYTGDVKGKQLGIKDILKLTAAVKDVNGNALNIDYEANGEYDHQNAGYDHVLKYQINSVTKKVKDGSGYANYVLDDAVLNSLEGSTLDSEAEQVYSVITPRQLNADVIKAAGNRKIYNGSDDADKSNFVLAADDQAILNKDNLLDNIVITAKYDNQNASVAPDGKDTNSKKITYTLTLNGTNSNYSIATPTAEAWGDIEQRRVYVEAADIKEINKTYDGTAELPKGFSNKDHFSLATGTDTGIVAGEENIQLNVEAIKGEYTDKHAGQKTINFSNFALKNEGAGSGSLDNYKLETDSIIGSGTIFQKELTIGIKAAPIKEYDTKEALSLPYANKANLDLFGVEGNDAVNLQVNSANYSDAKADTGKTYTYGVSINNTDYKLTQGTNLPAITVSNNGQTGVITANDGTITKRKVYVSLADTPNMVKTYDGNTSVEQDVTNKIIVRDGDLLDDGTELNRDAAVINARYDNKDAGDRTVTYNTQLKGDAADNYEIHRLSNINDAAADVEYSTLVGKGVINKAKLTLDPASMSKTYNGTSVIGDGKNAGDESLTKDKLVFKGVNNETFTLTDEAFAKVSGQYGLGNGDANVSWNGNEVAYKDVQYTGLSDALAVMNADAGTNAISKNYTIDNTATFDAAQAKGKIKPVTITQAATENWKPVIREYNADTDLSEVYDYSSGTIGQQLGINDILTLTVMDADGNPLTIDYTATGNYDHKNVGGTHVLNYHIDSVNKKVNDGKGEGNYVLDTSVLDALQGVNLDSEAEQVYSVITPRQLNAEVLKASDNRKIYDGTAAADTGNFVLDKADQAILSKDNLLNNVVITAYYDNENASIAPDGEAANSKTITYTLGLNDGNGNYQIATPTAKALGDIEQRRVYVEAVDVNNLDKIYDGTTAMPDGYTSDGRFVLTAADESTGIVAGDKDILLNTGAISGQYASAHVQRDADGRPTAQAIRFSNFTLQDVNAGNDNHAGNYYVVTDSLQGSGTITPKGLTVGIKAAPVKVYDGETALASTYAANDNLVLEGVLAGENANLLIDSAVYADANAGKNKEYSYQISLGNGDYELVQGANKPTLTVTDNGQSGTVTAKDGTITPRTLTASVIRNMTKVYDGTTDGVENAVANVSMSNVVNGDNLGLTATAVYDNPNAGKSEDTDELQEHQVTYTLSLTNPNYQLETDTLTGTGTISRKGITIVATPASVNMGEPLPKFTGTVEGLVPADSGLASSFTFDTLPGVSTSNVTGAQTRYPVYGWYRNSYEGGNFGLNYTYSQELANETAFTVNYINTDMGNPDLKPTPTHDVYRQIAKDVTSGFGDNNAASLQYVDRNGKVLATETIGSGTIAAGETMDGLTVQGTDLANIGIVGGDIVNLEGADAAGVANIEMQDKGAVVNLEVYSLNGEKTSADGNPAAEIVSTDSRNALGSIQIVDESGNVLEEIDQDKAEKQEKEGEIAIQSSDGQSENEIELTVESTGVNVA